MLEATSDIGVLPWRLRKELLRLASSVKVAILQGHFLGGWPVGEQRMHPQLKFDGGVRSC
jgi:hypothetical protein